MPVPLGLLPETPVATPSGERPLSAIAAGDRVLTYDVDAETWGEATVLACHDDVTDQLLRVAVDGHALAGATPGTGVWDAFEGAFRALGSVSTLSELILWRGGRAVAAPVTGLSEQAAPGQRVLHLVLAAPSDTFVADGVVVRHKEA